MKVALTRKMERKLSEDEKGIVLGILNSPHPILGCHKHPDFKRPERIKDVLEKEVPKVSADWYARKMSSNTTQEKNQSTVLTLQQEYDLFMIYNYARFKILETRKKIRKEKKVYVVKLLEWYKKSAKIEDILVKANLALVISVAASFNTYVDWYDLVDEGNNALLEAVRRFDFTRNLKFSTLAHHMIKNALISLINERNKIVRNEIQFAEEHIPWDFVEGVKSDRPHSVKLTDLIGAVVDHNIAELDDIEIEVLRSRYPMDGSQRVTLKVLAAKFGLSIPSIVRIEAKSFSKLRAFLSENAEKFGIS